MRCLRYKIVITTDVVHGWKKEITEIYFPTHDLFFNQEASFVASKSRAMERIDGAEGVVSIWLDPKLEDALDLLVQAIKQNEECMARLSCLLESPYEAPNL